MQELTKNHTGISAEFFVAAELSRRGYNVTFTLGNTKAIDLIIERDTKLISIQVKGIKRTKSICWNLKRTSVRAGIIYVFVNLHADTLLSPQYFILTSEEVTKHLKPTKSGRDYIDYNYMKKNDFENGWEKIDKALETK